MDAPDQQLTNAARYWKLTLGERLAGGTRSAVYAATDRLGRDLVVKVPQSRADAVEARAAEAAALTVWRDTGAAVLLVDATPHALLLVRARPGTNASRTPRLAPDGLVEIAAELLRRLWRAEPGDYDFPGLAEVYPREEAVAREDAAYERAVRGRPDRGSAGLDRLAVARSAAAELIATTGGPVLLHGDSSPRIWYATGPPQWVGAASTRCR
jgi:streptomycin 6-kinase